MVFNDHDKEIDGTIEISSEYECAKLKELFEQRHTRIKVHARARARVIFIIVKFLSNPLSRDR